MAPETHPARIHVLLARDAPMGLVIRRGPAGQVCTFGWDQTRDTFTLAQWLKGRIYERRCDLSPDGRHWIYFAMNGHWNGEAKGAWTAVARAPWLKALALLPKGDCWQGGGLFLDNTRYWVNGAACHERLRDTSGLTQDPAFAPPDWYGGECLTVYYNKLQRDGWTLVVLQDKQHPLPSTIFEKALHQGWVLRKICHAQMGPPRGKGVYWDEHALLAEGHDPQSFPDWEWADWVDGNLLYAEKGRLYRRAITDDRLSEPIMVHDFNAYTFEARAAPY